MAVVVLEKPMCPCGGGSTQIQTPFLVCRKLRCDGNHLQALVYLSTLGEVSFWSNEKKKNTSAFGQKELLLKKATDNYLDIFKDPQGLWKKESPAEEDTRSANRRVLQASASALGLALPDSAQLSDHLHKAMESFFRRLLCEVHRDALLNRCREIRGQRRPAPAKLLEFFQQYSKTTLKALAGDYAKQLPWSEATGGMGWTKEDVANYNAAIAEPEGAGAEDQDPYEKKLLGLQIPDFTKDRLKQELQDKDDEKIHAAQQEIDGFIKQFGAAQSGNAGD